MADTSKVQREVEKWVRDKWLSTQYCQEFRREKLKLTAGGLHEFAAVSSDNSIVACISTSEAKSPSTLRGTGKINKLRSDLYFLLMVEATMKLVIFTELDMYQVFLNEVELGRVPAEIDFALVKIENEALVEKLRAARKEASDEVRPIK